MDAETAKMKCLELAAQRQPLPDHRAVVEAAEAYWRWFTSRPEFDPKSAEGTRETSRIRIPSEAH